MSESYKNEWKLMIDQLFENHKIHGHHRVKFLESFGALKAPTKFEVYYNQYGESKSVIAPNNIELEQIMRAYRECNIPDVVNKYPILPHNEFKAYSLKDFF